MKKPKVIISWSSGKDSALTLYSLLQNNYYEVAGLLTVVTQDYTRVAMHGVREAMLEQQAKKLNLPLYKISIPKNCSNEIYQRKMIQILVKLEKQDISHIAFGDIFLEGIKKYREKQLEKTNIKPLFPLWKQDTEQLAKKFIAANFKAFITCIDLTKISAKFIGHEYNIDFVNKLPEELDPCGENGEFHTFVYAGPIFTTPINIKKGIIVKRNGFLFNDLVLK